MNEIKQFCTFYLMEHFFGIEVEKVQEVVRYEEVELTQVPLAHPVVSGLINLRGQIVTTIDLRKKLKMAERLPEQKPVNVVVRTEDGAVSFLVDEIGDVMETTEDSFEEPPETLQGMTRSLIRGAYKLKDRLLIVLDLEKILNLEKPAGV